MYNVHSVNNVHHSLLNSTLLHGRVSVGKVIHSMVAHLDAVTSLAVDPSGLYLLSGSECLHVNCILQI